MAAAGGDPRPSTIHRTSAEFDDLSKQKARAPCLRNKILAAPRDTDENRWFNLIEID